MDTNNINNSITEITTNFKNITGGCNCICINYKSRLFVTAQQLLLGPRSLGTLPDAETRQKVCEAGDWYMHGCY